MRLRTIFASALVVVVLVGSLCAILLAQAPIRARTIAATDWIIIEKAAHRMTLMKQGHVVRTYKVALGRGGLGPKVEAGDNKVPEGVYRITGRNPASAYHLSLRIGYPTALQAQRSHQAGIDPGGDIMIHAIRNGLGWVGSQHRRLDWTKGCIAVTNEEIEEIWRLVPDQTPVEIGA